jgi:hypothetical protein
MSSIAQSPAIYQPSDAEITPLLAAACTRWPQLISRIDRAQEILLSGGISLEPVAWEKRNVPYWQIASQSKADGSYIIPGSMGCHCPDRAPSIGERRFCKHTIVLACYLRILRNKLNADIRRFAVELSVLGNGELHAFAKRLGYVQVYNAGHVYKFSTQASPAHYAIWLAALQPAPVTWPVPVAVAA